MGIDDLRLSPELIAAWYPESLVARDEPATGYIHTGVKKEKPVAIVPYPFLGENNRSVCFLADYPEEDFLPSGQTLFLQKMLAACKYNLNDIALINIAHTTFSLADLRAQLNPRVIFLWGISPSVAGFKTDLPDFIISVVDGMSVIPVLNPEIMSGNSPEGVELKQRLWTCLKKLFGL